MKLGGKHKIITSVMWLIGIATILISMAGVWYCPLPEVQVKECTDLDGEAAYDYVNNIATNYPYRTYGTFAFGP